MVPEAWTTQSNITPMLTNMGEIELIFIKFAANVSVSVIYGLTQPPVVIWLSHITIAYKLAERGPMPCTAEMSPSITSLKPKNLPTTN